jgi:FkbM family methyltransferase
MKGIGRLKKITRQMIGSHRRSPAVRTLHGLAAFIESAYSNQGSDFQSNGERFLIERLIPAGFRTAFDVGANFGDWSEAAIAMWPKCHLHAFEVAPATFQNLNERIRDFGHCNRIAANCCGLSDLSGNQTMYYFPEHPDLTCDMVRHGAYAAQQFDAQLMMGDEYCDARGIDAVDFLKIDVEGAEYRVLRGFARRISERKIHCVQFEYGAFSTQTRFLLADYYALLSEGYWIGKIFPNYVEFRDYDWTMEDFQFCNYCCVSKLRADIRELLP